MIRVLDADGDILGGAGAFRPAGRAGAPGAGFATVAAPGAAPPGACTRRR